MNDLERWVPLPGSPVIHEISNRGRVRNKKTLRILRQSKNARGYLRITPSHRHIPIHRAVLLAFVGPPPAGHEAGHIDNNRTNNSLDNLCWITHSENQRAATAAGLCRLKIGEQHPHAVLTAEQVREIRSLCGTPGHSQSKLALLFGVHASTIWKIVHGRNWKDSADHAAPPAEGEGEEKP